MAGVIRWRGYAFFDELGGTEIKKDIAIPPEYRHIYIDIKNGGFDFSKAAMEEGTW
ncbi:hypothetical protein [Bacteroides caecimuris]|uniref:hypothetical protein n=1 Tax=Bacteroides caecimuris TaxID=1796613 RepID=UPI0026E1E261|nr:hypothetical protein [Bacteroides caecimuris]